MGVCPIELGNLYDKLKYWNNDMSDTAFKAE